QGAPDGGASLIPEDHAMRFSCRWAVMFLLVLPAVARAEDAPTKQADPFAFADFSWVPGNAGPSERPLTFGPFTGEFRLDDAYHYSFADPVDGTISGSSEVFRHGEFQVTQLGFGGDLLYKNVMGRLMT